MSSNKALLMVYLLRGEHSWAIYGETRITAGMTRDQTSSQSFWPSGILTFELIAFVASLAFSPWAASPEITAISQMRCFCVPTPVFFINIYSCTHKHLFEAKMPGSQRIPSSCDRHCLSFAVRTLQKGDDASVSKDGVEDLRSEAPTSPPRHEIANFLVKKVFKVFSEGTELMFGGASITKLSSQGLSDQHPGSRLDRPESKSKIQVPQSFLVEPETSENNHVSSSLSLRSLNCLRIGSCWNESLIMMPSIL